jgi:hypothetical protein
LGGQQAGAQAAEEEKAGAQEAMRDYKFRAFHDGEMLIDAARIGNALYWNNGLYFDLLAFKRENPAILMQYTMLIDNNNVEIYEDDIVVKFGGYTSVVMQHLGAFGYWGFGGDFIVFASNYHFDWVNNKSMNIEVIGNIHENPELVPDSKKERRGVRTC